jgi:hypothetical protein
MRQFLTHKLVLSAGRRARGLSQQRLAGTDPCGRHDIVADFKILRREHDDGRAVLEPAERLALADIGAAGLSR